MLHYKISMHKFGVRFNESSLEEDFKLFHSHSHHNGPISIAKLNRLNFGDECTYGVRISNDLILHTIHCGDKFWFFLLTAGRDGGAANSIFVCLLAKMLLKLIPMLLLLMLELCSQVDYYEVLCQIWMGNELYALVSHSI